MEFKYLFAKKPYRTLCLKYDEEWELSTFEYLVGLGYILSKANEDYYNRQIDDVGRPMECYLLDNKLKIFDIGMY